MSKKQRASNSAISHSVPFSPPPLVPDSLLKIESEMSHYSGPIPMPADMERYKLISPDLPSRIMSMAEKEQIANIEERERESRRKDQRAEIAINRTIQDEFIIRSNSMSMKLGMICALLSIMAIMATVITCAFLHQSITGSIIGGGGLVAIVVAFIYGGKMKPPRMDDDKPQD